MAGEIFEHAVLAFRREQLRQIASRKLLAVIAEQRFGAAIGRIDVALGVEHHDAFGRGVEDGGEFFGVGMADSRRFGLTTVWRLRLRCRRFEDVGLRCRLGSEIAAAIAAPSWRVSEKIKASAESPSHEIV